MKTHAVRFPAAFANALVEIQELLLRFCAALLQSLLKRVPILFPAGPDQMKSNPTKGSVPTPTGSEAEAVKSILETVCRPIVRTGPPPGQLSDIRPCTYMTRSSEIVSTN